MCLSDGPMILVVQFFMEAGPEDTGESGRDACVDADASWRILYCTPPGSSRYD